MEELPQFFPDEYETTLDERPCLVECCFGPSSDIPFEEARHEIFTIPALYTFHLKPDRFARASERGQNVFRIMDDLLRPGSDIEPQIAADSMVELYSSSLRHVLDGTTTNWSRPEDEFPGNFCYRLFYSMFYIVRQLAAEDEERQGNLAEFLDCLRKMPTTTHENTGIKCRWEYLPTISYGHIDSNRDIMLTTASREQQRTEDLNFNAFLARLTRLSGLNGAETLDFSCWGHQALVTALEEEVNSRSKEFHTQRAVWDANIPFAAQWIKTCGRVLFESDRKFDWRADGGRLWTGKNGFSRERWKFWRKRFRDISTFTQSSQEAKYICRKMAGLMEDIEGADTS